MFCPKCGRKLEDGEICICTAAHIEKEHTDPKSSFSLPDGQAIVKGAKNAATAIKNDPMISEVIDTIKGVIFSPIKQVSDNAYRTDILWIILTVLESVMTSFGITSIIRRGLYVLIMPLSSGTSYKEYSARLNESGLSALKIFGVELIWAFVSIASAVILIMLLMAVCRKSTGFSAVANMTVTAFLPSSIIMAIAGSLSFIYVPLGIIAAIAAVISATVLAYVGVQKLDTFDSPPFWRYVLCILILNIINILVGKMCLGQLLKNLIYNMLY